MPLDEAFALDAPLVDPFDAGGHPASCGAARGGLGSTGRDLEPDRPGRRLLRQFGQVVGAFAGHRVEDRQRHPGAEADLVPYGVDEAVHPRDAIRVRAGDAGQPQHRPLDRDGRVGAGHVDDRLAGLAGQRSGPADDGRIQIQLRRWLRLAGAGRHGPLLAVLLGHGRDVVVKDRGAADDCALADRQRRRRLARAASDQRG